MKCWMDTEFMEDGKTIELLSIGIVRDDGAEYYAVNAEADVSKANDWVTEHVLPHLDFAGARSRLQIANDIIAFMSVSGGGQPEIWGYLAAYDWIVFCQLFGRMIDLPEGFPMFCRDVKQLADDVGDPVLPPQQSIQHHALNDARWTREAYLFCMKRRLGLHQ